MSSVLLPEQLDLVDGALRSPALVLDGPSLCDPSTGAVLQPRRATDAGVIEQVIAAAHRVHRSGSWVGLPVAERAAWLTRIADELDTMGEELAVAESFGSGLPITVARMLGGSLGGSFRGAVAQLETGWLRTELPGPVRPVELLRLPWGPAAVLVPWNAPGPTAAGKVASALAAGCPVVLKATEWSPYSCGLMAAAIARVGLPAGVFQLIHGGPAAGTQLTSDRRIRAVCFTGGLSAGRAIARAAAEDFTAVQLELGGNNPVIVRADADIAATAASLASGMTKLNGQWCEGPGKVLVARERHDALVEALHSALGNQHIGHHLDEATTLGPLSHESHRAHLDGQVARLVDHGGRVITAGDLPDLPGWFWAPRLVTGLDPSACVDELFGPVVTVHPVDGDDRAVELANDTPFGLAGYVFSTDLDAAQAIGRRIRFGEVKVNGTSVIDLTPTSTQSFWGQSGIGGHGNAELFHFFTGSQIVGVDHTDVPI